jgi:hypothetical protein
VGVREGAAVAVGAAVEVGVAETKTVAVPEAAGSTVGGSLDRCSAVVSPGWEEMGGWAGAAQPPTRATISSHPIIRKLIDPGILRAITSSTDSLRRPIIAARIAQGIPDVKAWPLVICQMSVLIFTSIIMKI